MKKISQLHLVVMASLRHLSIVLSLLQAVTDLMVRKRSQSKFDPNQQARRDRAMVTARAPAQTRRVGTHG